MYHLIHFVVLSRRKIINSFQIKKKKFNQLVQLIHVDIDVILLLIHQFFERILFEEHSIAKKQQKKIFGSN